MRGRTEKLDKILQGFLLKKGITKNIQLNRVRAVLDKVFSKEESAHLKIGYLKYGKLYLYVDSAGLLYEIRCFKKVELLARINQELDLKLKDICLLMDNGKNG